MSEALKKAIKENIVRPYRRAFIKRKQKSTGLFESEWQEITEDVIRWGRIQNSSDEFRIGKLRFGGLNLLMTNIEGRYNDENSDVSLWWQAAGQQRTLLKIEAGFEHFSLGADGVWNISKTGEIETTLGVYDSTKGSYLTEYRPVFTGVVSGDMMTSDNNQVTMPIKPLNEVFRYYPASKLNDYTSSGLTASQFVEMVRDHTDGAGFYVFRPFFGDTATFWEISTTTIVYGDLNTSSSGKIAGQSVWNVMEKLAEAEQYIVNTTNDGKLRFVSVDSIVTTPVYEFHGLNSFDRDFGQTIKSVKAYGKRHSKYYARVEVKWDAADTSASYGVAETELQVSGLNEPWENGVKILSIDNPWIPSQSVAESIATQIFNNVQTSKYEINFTTVFVPQIEVFDRVSLTYDTEPVSDGNQLWDLGYWSGYPFTQSTLTSSTLTVATTLINNSTGRRLTQPFTTDTEQRYFFDFAIGLWKGSAVYTFSGYLIATLQKDNGSGVPTSTVLATSQTVPCANLFPDTSITSWSEAIQFQFPEPYIELDTSTTYHIVVSFDQIGFTGGSFVRSGYSNFTNGVAAVSNNSGSSYATTFKYSTVFQLNTANGPVSDVDESLLARWSGSEGQSLVLDDDEFRVIGVTIDLDNFETTIVAREI